jgi:hypothetical protein
MTYIPKNLKAWTLPRDYFGEHWDGWYVVIGHHRDSDLLVESNWDYCINALPESDTVNIVRENHWLVGWVEWLGIEKSDEASLMKADDIIERLNDYPVLAEEDFSNREWLEAESTWQNFTLADRINYLNRAGINIFASRRDSFPFELDESGSLFELLTA